MTNDELRPHDALFLGQQIRELIKIGGWFQNDIARRMKIDQSIMSLWAQNGRPVPHYRLPALAQALEVTVDGLLEGARVDRYSNHIELNDRLYDRKLQDLIPPEPEPVVAPLLARVVGPSTVPLAWCDRGHGGPIRRHNHGATPVWGPLGTIASFG